MSSADLPGAIARIRQMAAKSTSSLWICGFAGGGGDSGPLRVRCRVWVLSPFCAFPARNRAGRPAGRFRTGRVSDSSFGGIRRQFLSDFTQRLKASSLATRKERLLAPSIRRLGVLSWPMAY